MSQTLSPSLARCYGMARVSRMWKISRASVYRSLKETPVQRNVPTACSQVPTRRAPPQTDARSFAPCRGGRVGTRWRHTLCFRKLSRTWPMTDYYTTLIRIIRETSNDRAKLRGVVYEAARLSLRRQLNLQRPPLSFGETKRQLDELEEAIARVEASIAGIDLGSEPDEAETGLENGTHSGYSPRESGYDDASSLVEELRPWDTAFGRAGGPS
jgi:hypothetical protein